MSGGRLVVQQRGTTMERFVAIPHGCPLPFDLRSRPFLVCEFTLASGARGHVTA